jgi:hypothetical protein
LAKHASLTHLFIVTFHAHFYFSHCFSTTPPKVSPKHLLAKPSTTRLWPSLRIHQNASLIDPRGDTLANNMCFPPEEQLSEALKLIGSAQILLTLVVPIRGRIVRSLASTIWDVCTWKYRT